MLGRYLLSLPERTVRAGAALGGGLVAETAGVWLRARCAAHDYTRLPSRGCCASWSN